MVINDGVQALASAFEQSLRNAFSVKTKSSCSHCPMLSRGVCLQQRIRVEKLPICLCDVHFGCSFSFTLRVSFPVSDETWYVNLGKFRVRKTSRRDAQPR